MERQLGLHQPQAKLSYTNSFYSVHFFDFIYLFYFFSDEYMNSVS